MRRAASLAGFSVPLIIVVGSFGGACSFAGTTPETGNAVDGGPEVDAVIPVSEFRRPIELNPPSLTQDLARVPLAIRLDADPHLAGEILPDGADIFVIDHKGAQLPVEIERLDSSRGSLLAWVVLRELPMSGTTIYLHYGGDAATGNDRNPWEGVASLVWHMATIDGDIVYDSAPASFDGISQNGSVTPSDGMFAGALTLSDAAVVVSSEDNLNVDRNPFTLELWFNQLEAVGDNDTGFFKGGPTVGRPGYQMELGNGDWTGGVRDNDSGLFNQQEQYSVTFGNQATLGPTGWHHLAMVLDRQGDRLRAYVDGVETDSSGIDSLSSLNGNADKARVGGLADLLRGTLDEVRLIESAASADWVAVSYANGMDTLAVIGDPEASPIE